METSIAYSTNDSIGRNMLSYLGLASTGLFALEGSNFRININSGVARLLDGIEQLDK